MTRPILVNVASGANITTLTLQTNSFACYSGNLLVVAARLGSSSGSVSTITDLIGNTYTQITSATIGPPAFVSKINLFWAVSSGTNQNNQIISNFQNGSVVFTTLNAAQFQGNRTNSTVLDASFFTSESGTQTSISSPLFGTSFPAEVVIAVASPDNNPEAFTASSSSWQNICTDPSGNTCMFALYATAILSGFNVTISITSAQNWGMVGASFVAQATMPPFGAVMGAR